MKKKYEQPLLAVMNMYSDVICASNPYQDDIFGDEDFENTSEIGDF